MPGGRRPGQLGKDRPLNMSGVNMPGITRATNVLGVCYRLVDQVFTAQLYQVKMDLKWKDYSTSQSVLSFEQCLHVNCLVNYDFQDRCGFFFNNNPLKSCDDAKAI